MRRTVTWQVVRLSEPKAQLHGSRRPPVPLAAVARERLVPSPRGRAEAPAWRGAVDQQMDVQTAVADAPNRIEVTAVELVGTEIAAVAPHAPRSSDQPLHAPHQQFLLGPVVEQDAQALQFTRILRDRHEPTRPEHLNAGVKGPSPTLGHPRAAPLARPGVAPKRHHRSLRTFRAEQGPGAAAVATPPHGESRAPDRAGLLGCTRPSLVSFLA